MISIECEISTLVVGLLIFVLRGMMYWLPAHGVFVHAMQVSRL